MSDEANTSDDQGFLRQRRNLIAGSLIVLFLETTVSPPENLPILGITLKITNKDYIVYWLWALTSYWFVRYLQYSPPFNEIGWKVLREFRVSLKRYLKRLPKWQHPVGPAMSGSPKYLVYENDIYFPKPIKLTKIAFAYKAVHYKLKETGTQGEHVLDPHQGMELSWAQSIFGNLIAAVGAAFRTPLFTEYIVPILLFFIATVLSVLHRIG
jgi:hypothetical protein